MTGEMVGYGGATAVPAGIFIRKELHFLHSGTTVGGPGGRIERHCTMSKGDLPTRIGANAFGTRDAVSYQRDELRANQGII